MFPALAQPVPRPLREGTALATQAAAPAFRTDVELPVRLLAVRAPLQNHALGRAVHLRGSVRSGLLPHSGLFDRAALRGTKGRRGRRVGVTQDAATGSLRGS